MYVAKFNSTSGAPFNADKNGNYPYVGTVLAGVATNAIINGTMFGREKLVENKMYLCDNIDAELEDGTKVVNTLVISEIGVTDFVAFRREFGAGKLNRVAVEAEANAEAVANEA